MSRTEREWPSVRPGRVVCGELSRLMLIRGGRGQKVPIAAPRLAAIAPKLVRSLLADFGRVAGESRRQLCDSRISAL